MEGNYTHQSIFLELKVAYLYYINNNTQNEIAKQLGVSVPTVSRLLKKAKEEKIIEFVIRDPYLECIHLEEKLKEAFHLKETIIAPGFYIDDLGEEQNYTDNGDSVKNLVALEGARYLQRIIKENDVLGVTWGSTVYQMINYLNPAQKVDATFVTLHGSIASVAPELDVRTLVSRISKGFAGKNYPLLTEALMSSKSTADIIKQEKNISRVYDFFDKINISVAGTGSFYPEMRSILGTEEFMSKEDIENLKEQNVVGDIALRFFDREGKECQTSLVDRMISIDFDKYKKIPTKIVVASGVHKAYTILSALKGGLIDVLIVDYELGLKILEFYQNEKNHFDEKLLEN